MLERFARSARVAVVLAQEEARELSAEEIRPEHLLVGVLQSAGRGLAGLLRTYGLTVEAVRERLQPTDSPDDEMFHDDAEALRAIGIDLHAVRDKIARTFGEAAWNDALRKSGRRRRRYGHLPFTRASKKALELALREAVAHKRSSIGCEHLMLGILQSGDQAAVALITEHVDASRLHDEITTLLEQAA